MDSDMEERLALQVIHWLERISNNIHEVGDAVGARMTPPSGDEFNRLQTRVMLLGQERDNLYDQLQEAKAEIERLGVELSRANEATRVSGAQNRITDLESIIVSRDHELAELKERYTDQRRELEETRNTFNLVQKRANQLKDNLDKIRSFTERS